MRVLVCGGRDYFDKARLFDVLDYYHREAGGFDCIIHGNAFGADSLADQWAKERGIEPLPFPADWVLYGRAAGPRRNEQMLRDGKPEVVIAFPGGRGTANMIGQARAAGVPVLEIP